MTDYQQRVVQEHDELNEKLDRLHDFIESGNIFKGLDKVDQRHLIDQRVAMIAYRDILHDRMVRFSEGHGDVPEGSNFEVRGVSKA